MKIGIGPVRHTSGRDLASALQMFAVAGVRISAADAGAIAAWFVSPSPPTRAFTALATTGYADSTVLRDHIERELEFGVYDLEGVLGLRALLYWTATATFNDY